MRLGILKNIAEGLRELHNADFYHGDVKPHNVLMCDIGSDRLVLSDFGLSDMNTSEAHRTKTRHTLRTKGTLVYCAPEMLSHDSNNHTIVAPSRKTDMYAFAILAWEILTGKISFEDVAHNEQKFISNVHSSDEKLNRPSLRKLSGTPPEIVEMITAC